MDNNVINVLKFCVIAGVFIFLGNLLTSIGVTCILLLMEISLITRIILNIILIISLVSIGLYICCAIKGFLIAKDINISINGEEL